MRSFLGISVPSFDSMPSICDFVVVIVFHVGVFLIMRRDKT